MNSDSYFEIGSTHLVCQDYALSGSFKDMTYGIVSDGCSSAEYSEIGAQILCHATRYFLTLYYDLFFNETLSAKYIAELLGKSIRARADEIRKLYPISRDSLQATLLIALYIKTEDTYKAFVFVWGDGVVITSSKIANFVSVAELDYPETNAPVYLMTDFEAYKRKFNAPDQLRKQFRNYDLFPDSNDVSPDRVANETFKDIDIDVPAVYSFPAHLGDFIMIATDGLTQYQDQNKKPIDSSFVIPDLFDYPNFNGQFLKRTMNFMKRDMVKKSWSHADDIGLATIVLNS